MNQSRLPQKSHNHSAPGTVPPILVWPFAAIILLQLMGAVVPVYGTWGFQYWSLFPVRVSIVVLVVATLIVTVPHLRRGVTMMFSLPVLWIDELAGRVSPGKRVAAVSALLLILFLVFRSRAHVYGDGFLILSLTGGEGDLFAGQLYLKPLTAILFRYLSRFASEFVGLSTEYSVAIINSIGGVAAVWALDRIASVLSDDPRRRWLIFIGSLTSGAVVLFFGYIEYYTWPMAVALWSVYYLLRHVQGENLALRAVLLAVMASALHLIMVPILAVAILVAAGRAKVSLPRLFGISWLVWGVMCILGSLGLALLFQSAGSERVLMPLWTTPRTAYTVFSAEHLLDLVNLALLVAPAGVVAFLIVLFRKRAAAGGRDAPARVLAAISLLTVLASFWIAPNLGVVRDWDLLSQFGLPLSLWGMLVLIRSSGYGRLSGSALVPATVTALVLLVPNLKEKINLETAALHLDDIVWQSPQYQVDHYQAERAGIWAAKLRDQVERPDLAVRYFRRVLQADSSAETAWFCIGEWYADQGKYDSAAVYLRQVAFLRSNNVDYLLKLALVEARLGNNQQARLLALHCLSLKPDDYQVQLSAGIVTEQAGLLDSAMIHYRTAARIQPGAPEAWLSIGAAFNAMKQYDSAYYYLAPLHQRFPKIKEIYLPLLKAQVELGKEQEAARTFQLYRERYPDAKMPEGL